MIESNVKSQGWPVSKYRTANGIPTLIIGTNISKGATEGQWTSEKRIISLKSSFPWMYLLSFS